MSANLQKLLTLVRTRRPRLVARVLGRWLWGDRLSYGLQRACGPPLRLPPPAIPLRVRPREPGDELAFTALDAELADDAVLVRINAAHLLLSGVETCFVAVTDSGTPCGMQYLIDSSRNEELDEVFGGLVPRLQADEGLLEFAFTLEPYRAKGVMPHLLTTPEASPATAAWRGCSRACPPTTARSSGSTCASASSPSCSAASATACSAARSPSSRSRPATRSLS